MPNYVANNTAAVAIVDADLFSGEVWARAPQDRIVNGLCYTGSAVVGDTEVQFFADEVRIGSMFNTKLLTPDGDDWVPLEGLFVPGGALLRCIVRDAAATSVVFSGVALEDVE